MRKLFWLAITILVIALIVTVQWALAQEPARVLLLGGHFDSKLERMRLTLDVSEPGVYLLRIERTNKVTRLIVEDVKTGKVIWAGKLERE